MADETVIKITPSMRESTSDPLLDWYVCPKCDNDLIFPACNFCPECGVKLDTSDIQPGRRTD
jgi:hypothetical protein